MKPIIRNIIAVVVGLVIGNVVNMSLIQMGMNFYPIDVDMSDMVAISDFMETADSKYFLFPFLAHAAGTLVGAFIAAMISKNRKLGMALIVGVFFLAGGVLMVLMVAAPSWFITLDLVGAYIPMALLGALFATILRPK